MNHYEFTKIPIKKIVRLSVATFYSIEIDNKQNYKNIFDQQGKLFFKLHRSDGWYTVGIKTRWLGRKGVIYFDVLMYF